VTELGRKQLLINGQWRDAFGGATMAVVNPATEVVIADVASATAEDVNAAVEAAHAIGVACCGSSAIG
jgi:succinate-semialdehyde dehydrogenase/glutarate-semialdehyde dehydrogenase